MGTVRGAASTSLDGKFVRMVDTCGAIDESSAIEELDLLRFLRGRARSTPARARA
jgi:hypothetical protein